jgi:hypothetical protein
MRSRRTRQEGTGRSSIVMFYVASIIIAKLISLNEWMTYRLCVFKWIECLMLNKPLTFWFASWPKCLQDFNYRRWKYQSSGGISHNNNNNLFNRRMKITKVDMFIWYILLNSCYRIFDFYILKMCWKKIRGWRDGLGNLRERAMSMVMWQIDGLYGEVAAADRVASVIWRSFWVFCSSASWRDNRWCRRL